VIFKFHHFLNSKFVCKQILEKARENSNFIKPLFTVLTVLCIVSIQIHFSMQNSSEFQYLFDANRQFSFCGASKTVFSTKSFLLSADHNKFPQATTQKPSLTCLTFSPFIFSQRNSQKCFFLFLCSITSQEVKTCSILKS
jgi:hypothetical protein